MAPLPKKKHSHGRTATRRSTFKAVVTPYLKCASCGELKPRHKACPSCGK